MADNTDPAIVAGSSLSLVRNTSKMAKPITNVADEIATQYKFRVNTVLPALADSRPWDYVTTWFALGKGEGYVWFTLDSYRTVTPPVIPPK